VGIGATGKAIVYRVTDEGPGIPDADWELIFDIYVTRDDGKKQGIGLGLPLSRRLARLLGGELRVIPRPLPTARGACFELELPARPES